MSELDAGVDASAEVDGEDTSVDEDVLDDVGTEDCTVEDEVAEGDVLDGGLTRDEVLDDGAADEGATEDSTEDGEEAELLEDVTLLGEDLDEVQGVLVEAELLLEVVDVDDVGVPSPDV